MPHPANRYSLVADIGGTNTRCALAEGQNLVEGTMRRYVNADHGSLDAVLQCFIADEGGVDPVAACVAVAGPVRGERASLTNLDWEIDTATLTRATRAERVAILNDLQAQGHALGHIDASRIRTILPFPAAPLSLTRIVIGVGTGFNAAPVFDLGGVRIVPPSESGHVNLPVRDESDLRLSRFVAAARSCPSVEDVLSGRGLEAVYRWLSHEAGSTLAKPAHEIMAAVDEGSDPQAVETARIVTRLLGAAASNLALTQLPFGGVYLVGGVSRAIAPHLAGFGFGTAFRDKGRFSDFMDNFGVGVIEDDYAALTGAAAYISGPG